VSQLVNYKSRILLEIPRKGPAIISFASNQSVRSSYAAGRLHPIVVLAFVAAS
jgi:hypothetical protein